MHEYQTRLPSLLEAEETLNSLGMDSGHARKFKAKFKNLRSHAPHRSDGMGGKCECFLSFRQYLLLARKAGITHPSEIGPRRGQHHMSRKGDTGDYVWGNCRFLLSEENHAERKTNGGSARAAEKKRGRTKHNDSGCARQAQKMRGRTAKTHTGIARMVEKKTGRTKDNDEGLRRSSEKQSRLFIAISPTGTKYKRRNLKEFCKVMCLNRGNMSNVFNGRSNHAKGWTGYYID